MSPVDINTLGEGPTVWDKVNTMQHIMDGGDKPREGVLFKIERLELYNKILMFLVGLQVVGLDGPRVLSWLRLLGV